LSKFASLLFSGSWAYFTGTGLDSFALCCCIVVSKIGYAATSYGWFLFHA